MGYTHTVVSSRGKSRACAATFIERKTRMYLAVKKGKDFTEVTDEELARALHLINHRPRKCLGWKSAYETFMEALSHLA